MGLEKYVSASILLLIYLFINAEPRDTPKGAYKQKAKQKGTDCFVFQWVFAVYL